MIIRRIPEIFPAEQGVLRLRGNGTHDASCCFQHGQILADERTEWCDSGGSVFAYRHAGRKGTLIRITLNLRPIRMGKEPYVSFHRPILSGSTFWHSGSQGHRTQDPEHRTLGGSATARIGFLALRGWQRRVRTFEASVSRLPRGVLPPRYPRIRFWDARRPALNRVRKLGEYFRAFVATDDSPPCKTRVTRDVRIESKLT
jgi:hypothetical protein